MKLPYDIGGREVKVMKLLLFEHGGMARVQAPAKPNPLVQTHSYLFCFTYINVFLFCTVIYFRSSSVNLYL